MEHQEESDDKKLVDVSGEEISAEKATARKRQRMQENREYQPVIIKRNDETFRHPDDILETAIKEGMEQFRRPILSLALSSFAAGMILCFTVMAVALVYLGFEGPADSFSNRVTLALFYPVGFVLCILSRTQLFTEHTATAVYPVLEGKEKVNRLFRLWMVIICGNLIGGWCSANLLLATDDIIGAAKGYELIAKHLISFDNKSIIVSAILAGWLMALGAWITLSTQSTLSQIISIYLVTFVIGLGGFHHSIAGSIEMFSGYLSSSSIPLSEAIRFIALALIGNAIGGSLFVAVLNYGHIRHSQME